MDKSGITNLDGKHNIRSDCDARSKTVVLTRNGTPSFQNISQFTRTYKCTNTVIVNTLIGLSNILLVGLEKQLKNIHLLLQYSN